MTAWTGPIGSLIPFYAPSSVESSSVDSHVYFTPLGGDVAATVLGDPVRPRVWEVGISAAYPHEVAAIEGLSYGEWGIGPFTFIPPAAETKNLLGKRDSLAMGTAGTGYVMDNMGTPVHTTEGVAGSHYATTSTTPPTMSLGDAPVIPGRTVTGKAWVQPLNGATASVDMVFYTAGHAALATVPAATTTGAAGAFLSITATAPDGAAYVRLRASGAVITRPSVTWTAEPRTWAPSAASTNVVLSPLSDAVRLATGMAGEESITDHKFTVTELRA